VIFLSSLIHEAAPGSAKVRFYPPQLSLPVKTYCAACAATALATLAFGVL
jgi:hypothetical protein